MKQVRRVLVVEDDRDTRTMVEEVLIGGGFDVDTAGDSNTALRKIGATRYDLAIVDLMLPDLDGVLLHDKIARVDPRLAERLVFTTGFTDQPAVIDFVVPRERSWPSHSAPMNCWPRSRPPFTARARWSRDGRRLTSTTDSTTGSDSVSPRGS